MLNRGGYKSWAGIASSGPVRLRPLSSDSPSKKWLEAKIKALSDDDLDRVEIS
jgi:hypothetical protein